MTISPATLPSSDASAAPATGGRVATARAAVVGAGGYAGAELVSILHKHAHGRAVGLFGSDRREQPTAFAELHPRHRGRIDLPVQATSVEAIRAVEPDVVFLATPHEVSHDLVPPLLGHGIVVIDLSAAYRLCDPALYESHYGFVHRHRDVLAHAVYGLPEINRDRIATADLIAAPGCYPTSVILPLHPLVRAGAIDRASLVIADCTSGVSGAGRAPALKTHLCEVSLQPYHVLRHRHAPEMAQHAGVEVAFTPHLGPYERGILSTMHATLADGWNLQRVKETLEAAYAEEPFVRLLPDGCWPALAHVEHTNLCEIGLVIDEPRRHLVLVSAIDNLLKGAAGQAVQCMNRRFGYPETEGLS